MSNFRDKANAIKAEGEAKRGDFTPQGAPLRSYNYWLENSDSKKARAINSGSLKENFCHFWRVVAIWSPLLKVGKRADRVVTHEWFGPSALALLVVGVVAGVLFGGGLPALGIMLVVLAGIAAFFAFIVGIMFWHEKYPEFSTKVGQRLGIVLITASVLFALFLFVSGTGWGGVIVIGLAGVLGAVVYKNVENIADYIQGLRDRAEERERIAKQKRKVYLNAYFNEHGYYPSEAPAKEPGRVKQFFRGVGDFVIMAAQVIRVNKWKICPLVELKTEKIDYDSGWETA